MSAEKFYIRKGIIESSDYERFAQMVNQVEGTIITGKTILGFDNNLIKGDMLERYAACLSNVVIGYGILFRAATAQDEVFSINVIIDASYRSNGYGSLFFNHLSDRAIKLGAKAFNAYCQDDDSVSLSFAKSRGFTIQRHIWQSELDLEQFDISKWQQVLDRVRAQGIRFSSLENEGKTDESLRKLYDLNVKTAYDNPSYDGTYKQTFENWMAKIANAHWFRADGQILAIDGDRYVGLGAIGFDDNANTCSNAFTGVDSEYRGRKIALALKILGAQFTKDNGVSKLITNNDSKNEPMLAINRRLGYRRTNGEYWLTKCSIR